MLDGAEGLLLVGFSRSRARAVCGVRVACISYHRPELLPANNDSKTYNLCYRVNQ